MKVSVIVLNYNGKDLIEECLPSIIEAAKKTKHNGGITVLDNRSNDGSIELLKVKFPTVTLVISETNKVFCSFNPLVENSNADIVILLNNDIKVEENFIDPLVDCFSKYRDAFFAGPKCLGFDKTTYEGTKAKWFIDKGMFKASARYNGYEKDINRAGYTMQAGFGAFDKQRFLGLGGFDNLYLPGILEDADLFFKGWKMGYKAYYQPESLIYHIGQATFKKEFGSKKTMTLAHRNTFLFMWKNISDIKIWLAHLFWLPIRIFYFLLSGKIEFLFGFIKALPKLPEALIKRTHSRNYLLSDKEVFTISENI